MSIDQKKVDELQSVADELLVKAKADRITIRLDVMDMDYPVIVEAERDGVPKIGHLTDIGQRDLETVRWIAREERILVVPDALNHDPAPPAALTEGYGLTAFLLAPLGKQKSGDQVGWISVHVNTGKRDWTDRDIAVTEQASQAVKSILGDFAPLPSQHPR